MEDRIEPQMPFDEAFRAHFASIAHYAEYRGAREGEDVAQEAMTRMWLQGEAVNRGGAGAWLRTVAGRITIDQYRAARARPDCVYPENLEPFFGGVEDVDPTDAPYMQALAKQALDCMSDSQREAVETVVFQGNTVPEAARLLGIPEGTVRSRQYYGMRAARKAFAELGIDSSVLGQ